MADSEYVVLALVCCAVSVNMALSTQALIACPPLDPVPMTVSRKTTRKDLVAAAKSGFTALKDSTELQFTYDDDGTPVRIVTEQNWATTFRMFQESKQKRLRLSVDPLERPQSSVQSPLPFASEGRKRHAPDDASSGASKRLRSGYGDDDDSKERDREQDRDKDRDKERENDGLADMDQEQDEKDWKHSGGPNKRKGLSQRKAAVDVDAKSDKSKTSSTHQAKPENKAGGAVVSLLCVVVVWLLLLAVDTVICSEAFSQDRVGCFREWQARDIGCFVKTGSAKSNGAVVLSCCFTFGTDRGHKIVCSPSGHAHSRARKSRAGPCYARSDTGGRRQVPASPDALPVPSLWTQGLIQGAQVSVGRLVNVRDSWFSKPNSFKKLFEHIISQHKGQAGKKLMDALRSELNGTRYTGPKLQVACAPANTKADVLYFDKDRVFPGKQKEKEQEESKIEKESELEAQKGASEDRGMNSSSVNDEVADHEDDEDEPDREEFRVDAEDDMD
jgi:hypothetical protein